MNLPEIVGQLIESLDDEQGVSEATYLGICNLIENVYGESAMQTFCDSVDATEDRYFVHEGYGQILREKVVSACSSDPFLVGILSSAGQILSCVLIDAKFDSNELASINDVASHYNQIVSLQEVTPTVDVLTNLNAVKEWIRNCNDDYETHYHCNECNWVGTEPKNIMVPDKHNPTIMLDSFKCPECGSEDVTWDD